MIILQRKNLPKTFICDSCDQVYSADQLHFSVIHKDGQWWTRYYSCSNEKCRTSLNALPFSYIVNLAKKCFVQLSKS